MLIFGIIRISLFFLIFKVQAQDAIASRLNGEVKQGRFVSVLAIYEALGFQVEEVMAISMHHRGAFVPTAMPSCLGEP